jgi:hypothetical protein
MATAAVAQQRPSPPPPPLVALAGWILPGAGYWLIGQRARAVVVGATILLLFFLGIFVAGIRVIDVPGYDEYGQKTLVRTNTDRDGAWVLTTRPLAEIINKPWYVGQILAGPITLVASRISLNAAAGPSPYPKTKARLGEIGTLYTAVAGMLNLLAIIDAAHRASAMPRPTAPGGHAQ